ncbi:hypothetical protein [uncultured Brevundimonas sp.]|uniref:hypothetical protein n=1 Tax=uncultured Brevundimonas sp. TaxID=213418 RepID=UPI00261D27EA|nr:hypothetical protein [uncultured Brevundimonas sp.]
MTTPTMIICMIMTTAIMGMVTGTVTGTGVITTGTVIPMDRWIPATGGTPSVWWSIWPSSPASSAPV